MILIPIMEAMDGILGEMHIMVDKLENGSIQLQEDCADYVQRLESSASKYRMPIAGQLSVIRGKILCGAPESECSTRKEKKAAEKRYLLTQLESAYNCVSEYFEGERKIIGECERLVCQITSRLVFENAFKGEVSGGDLIKLASKNNELAPILVHITGLIGVPNTNILFEKTMHLAGMYGESAN